MREELASHANYSAFVVWDFRPLGTKDPCQKKKCFSRHLCFFHSCIHISNSSYGSVVFYLKKEIRFTLGLFWLLDIKQGYGRKFFSFFFLPGKVTSGTNRIFNWLSLTQLCCVLKKLLKSVNMVTSWTSAGSYNTQSTQARRVHIMHI